MENSKERRVDNWLSLFQLQINVDAQLEKLLREQTDLTLKEFYILYYLYQNRLKNINLSELEKYISLSQSAMSRMLMRMENKEDKIIERHYLPGNKKEIYVKITKIGIDVYLKSLDLVDEVLQTIFTGDHLSCLSIKLK